MAQRRKYSPSLSLNEWRKYYKQWLTSGLSRTEYARRNGINPSTFSNASRKIEKEELLRSESQAQNLSKAPEVRLVEIPVSRVLKSTEVKACSKDSSWQPEQSSGWSAKPTFSDGIYVHLRNNLKIEVVSDFDPALLRKLVFTLDGGGQ